MTDDAVRFGGARLWHAVRAAAQRTAKWTHLRRPRAVEADLSARLRTRHRALVALLSSCTKLSSSSNAVAPKSWTIHGIVRLAVAEEPNSLIRMFSNQSSADDVTSLLFEPFFRYDDRERPVPALATQFPTLANGLISKDGLRITFPLRRSAVWSDGQPVTAQDVIFTWHAIVDGRNPVVYTAGYDKIKSMIADNAHRVTFVMKQPFSPAVYLFSEGTFPPLPAHLLSRDRSIDNIPYDQNPIGDGPFVLRQWLHGSTSRLFGQPALLARTAARARD